MFNKGDKVQFQHSAGTIEGTVVKITAKGIQIQDCKDQSILTLPSYLLKLLKPVPSAPAPAEKSQKES